VVTGGSSGIGLAIARRLVDEGYTLVLIARDAARLAQASSTLGPSAANVAANLGVRSEVEMAIDFAAARLGQIDVLINAAGYTQPLDAGMPLEQAEHTLNEVLTANLTSTFLTTLATLAHMPAPGGRVINISSIAAQVGSSGPGGLAYAAAKAGIHGFTFSLARELGARGITVNVIAPGLIRDTRFFGEQIPEDRVRQVAAQTPIGRAGVPDDIASAAAWLASAHASFVTGTVLSVNGGWRVG
jgi:3-oxoacyl-[acyl-carrier protein] reductase